MSSDNKIRDGENKRKRLTQACELCRRKKIKCDGGKPTCENCTKLNFECTYSTNNKKRGPRQGYIEMLEQRLAKMEQILLAETNINSTQIEENPVGSNSNQSITLEKATTEHNVQVDPSQPKSLQNNSKPEQNQPVSVTPNLSSLINSNENIPNPINSVCNTAYRTISNTTSDIINNAKSKHLSNKSKRSFDDSNDNASPTSFSSVSTNFPSPPAHIINNQANINETENSLSILPPMHIIEHIVDLFFKYLFSSIPIFNESTLRSSIKEKKCPTFLILSLLAATARFSDHPDVKESPAWRSGESYAEKAREMIIKVVDEPTIPHLQGLLLMSLHEYGCGRGPRSWMYTGITIRMAIELDLYEDMDDDISSKDNQTFEKLISLEVRRGLFWSIFSMDKFSSAATGRPSTLPEKFCTAFLPARVDEYNDEQYYTENLDGSRFILLNVNGLKDSQLIGSGSPNKNSEESNSTSPSLERRPHLNCFAYLMRAVNLLSKVTAYVNLKRKEKHDGLLPCHPNSKFYKLDQSIQTLAEQLPAHLRNTPENLETYKHYKQNRKKTLFILLHILYNATTVLLHRPSLVIAESLDNEVVQPELKSFVHNSVEKCMNAVDEVTRLLKEIGDDKELMPPFLTYLTHTVATVVVNTSFCAHPEKAQKAKQALGVYFQLLLSSRSLWAMADKLYFMIRDLYAIHSNVLKKQIEMKKVPNSHTLYQDLHKNNAQANSSNRKIIQHYYTAHHHQQQNEHQIQLEQQQQQNNHHQQQLEHQLQLEQQHQQQLEQHQQNQLQQQLEQQHHLQQQQQKQQEQNQEQYSYNVMHHQQEHQHQQQLQSQPHPHQYQYQDYTQFRPQIQSHQLPLFQSFQLQSTQDNLNNNNSAVADWTLSYYNAAMLYEAPPLSNNPIELINDITFFSNNLQTANSSNASSIFSPTLNSNSDNNPII